jgi:hypothetical protein
MVLDLETLSMQYQVATLRYAQKTWQQTDRKKLWLIQQ